MNIIKRVLIGLIIFLVILVVVVGVYINRSIPRSFPQTDGTITIEGLEAPVDIYRDDLGIPHVFASSENDLFFAQGYVHAQDRFWQMDLWRHQGAGRLSELLGSNTLELDMSINTMGFERTAREELANLDAQSLEILEAYAQGVNAYLADHEGISLSLEYLFLNLLNSGYEPKPWEPLNTLTWAKAMAYSLGGNMDSEILRAQLLKVLSPEKLDQIDPPYPDDHPYIVLDQTPFISAMGHETSISFLEPEMFTSLGIAEQRLRSLDTLFGYSVKEGIGSNSWVVSGELTSTGMPLLANDPHLAVQMPSIWYEIGLHCAPKGPDCPYEAVGFSFAGVPGVVIGHNDHIAWGLTNTGPDVMDLYIEKINPQNPNQYEFEGQWVNMEIITETIEVAGSEPFELTVRLTRHGPIITDTFGLDEFDQEVGVEVPGNFDIALRWTALEPNNTLRSIWGFNRAQNWEEFREAAREFAAPAQNLVYADVEGNIGYQMPGSIPIRLEGHSGRFPVPGWTGENEWQGYIPFEELPYAYNPPEGYIVTANNAVVSPAYPYMITYDWAAGYRAQRIVDMLESAPPKIDFDYIKQMQGDDMNLGAELVVPVLMQVTLDDQHLEDARDLLAGWDYQVHMDSPAAALYEMFWKGLLDAAFNDDLPDFAAPFGGGRWFLIVSQLLEQPESDWWDDASTSEIEMRDHIFSQAFAWAVDELENELGKDMSEWAWGKLHTTSFNNMVMSSFPLINNLFNRGPFPTSGGSGIVNATGWSTAADNFSVGSLPSMRMIVDLQNLQKSLTMHTTGQSGHAYHPHYIDMADNWRKIEYSTMHWDRLNIENSAVSHLQLVP
jgi:penicillin amidase